MANRDHMIVRPVGYSGLFCKAYLIANCGAKVYTARIYPLPPMVNNNGFLFIRVGTLFAGVAIAVPSP